MFCPNCGEEMAENVNFCSNCGQTLHPKTGITPTGPSISGLKGHQDPPRYEYCEIFCIPDGTDNIKTLMRDTMTSGLYSKLFNPRKSKFRYIANATGSRGIYVAAQTEFGYGGEEILSRFIQTLAKDGWEVTGKNPVSHNYELKRREK
jgi:hypothetical protein